MRPALPLPLPLLRRTVPRVANLISRYRPILPNTSPLLTRHQSQRRPPPEPHKEYFQRPGQFAQQYQESFESAPPPPATSFNRGRQQSQQQQGASRFYNGQGQHAQQQKPVWRRILRASLWSDMFLLLGLLSGTALITWEYVSPAPTLTAAERASLYAEIQSELDAHPVVQGLKEDGWVPQLVYENRSAETMMRWGMELYEKLFGTGAVMLLEFAHPEIKFTVLVIFLGEGVEDGVWPDTVGGGVVSSLLLLAAERHVRRCDINVAGMGVDEQGRARGEEELVPALGSFTVDFRGTVQPADIYTIVVPQAVESGMVLDESSGEEMRALTVTPLMLHLDHAPKLTVASIEETQTLVQNLAVEDSSTLSLQDALYAMGTLQCFVRKVKRNEDDG